MQVREAMHRCGTNWPFKRMSALAFIGLAICVFTWGLQYKLSLYDPSAASSPHIPTAKLLSKNEQSGPTESPLMVRTRRATKAIYTIPAAEFFVLLLIFSVLNPPQLVQLEQRASRLWQQRRAHLRSCIVRPPPVLA